jgi:hypothetical protein
MPLYANDSPNTSHPYAFEAALADSLGRPSKRIP